MEVFFPRDLINFDIHVHVYTYFDRAEDEKKRKRGREIIDIQIDSPVTAERLPHQDV